MITKRDINSIESLLLLLAVTQHSNKRKASEALNTSVDTINKYIDNLEQDLSLKLLYSDSRGTNLTENGKKILESAKQITDIIHGMYSATIENTDMLGNLTDADKAALIQETPLLRLGEGADIAAAVAFLAREDTGFITGQVLGVNGGLVI